MENIVVEWWYWVALGVILSVAEIFILGFFLIWLGISAIFVGIVSFFVLFPLSFQIFGWAVGSLLLLWLWYGYFRGNSQNPDSNIGQSDEYRGVKGEITEELGGRRYRASFDIPILGDREWIVESEDALSLGDEIISDKVYGQLLKVKKSAKI